MKRKIKPIAFVLPQFHPIPENDAWWGKGFTEWTNVTKAKPLFEGHYQPHLPTDLGFYDLRLPEARQAQADLAKAYGIEGFCYYHYWFNGKRLLNQPIDGMLQQKDLEMPFMLCWANENWTRRWDGKEHDILIEQNYNLDDDKAHMRWLCENVFSDERYIKVDGKPVFLVYRYGLLPNYKVTISIWRDIVKNEFNFKGIYICAVESFSSFILPEFNVFDGIVEFGPHRVIKHKLNYKAQEKWYLKLLGVNKNKRDFRDFKKGVKESIARREDKYKLYRCVTPSWDNTARKGQKGTVALGSSPELYCEWLSYIVKKFKPFSTDENFVFINAMNEWAEGNHLEPCIKYGTAYLEATKKALDL
ncbi:glycoside hydrolase family 99-like domain-containing protein [Aestuariibaculum marinum]|uniref:Glycoside hydrolase family 99-like domain-containing protein n=1 Tax=Aestuariibaculum marinum TaxID=2683592 RepID=A0A8J6Q9Q6_9FLAO|nr:glycoside hydrolase family 99-like domain-containing protein [Aestuariibaculum marinum]MBD0823866.1 glycoside hydrolase family 99-like domain-containing protein [Aestuariibaculum marinum]